MVLGLYWKLVSTPTTSKSKSHVVPKTPGKEVGGVGVRARLGLGLGLGVAMVKGYR